MKHLVKLAVSVFALLSALVIVPLYFASVSEERQLMKAVEDNDQVVLAGWLGKSRLVPREQCTIEKRVVRLREQCRLLGLDRNLTVDEVADMISRHKMYSLYYVDDRHKIIYCPTPKTASTTFRHLLMQATGQNVKALPMKEAFHKIGLGFLSDDYTRDEIAIRLKKYLKLIVVRHPMDRLVSAHNHRFVEDWQFPHHIPNFANLTRQYYNRTFNADPRDVLDFGRFIELLSKEPSTFKDGHWKTLIDCCHPCEIQYDYIIRLETLAEDIDPVLERLGSPTGGISSLPNYTRLRSTTNKLLASSKAYSEISVKTITDLMDTYGSDMELFGYTWTPESGLDCAFVSEDGLCC